MECCLRSVENVPVCRHTSHSFPPQFMSKSTFGCTSFSQYRPVRVGRRPEFAFQFAILVTNLRPHPSSPYCLDSGAWIRKANPSTL